MAAALETRDEFDESSPTSEMSSGIIDFILE